MHALHKRYTQELDKSLGAILFHDSQLGQDGVALNGPFESAAGAELEEVHLGVTSSIEIIHLKWP